MAGEKQIRAAFRQPRHSHFRSAHQIPLVVALRQIKWMMSDNRLYHSVVEGAELFLQPRNLRSVNAPPFNHRRACGIYAYDNQLVVFVNWLEIVGDVALVFCQWLEKPGKDIMHRNIMISRHNYLRLRQSIKESTRLLELVRACALCKVAGDGDEVRLDFSDSSRQRTKQVRIHTPEVQV